MGVYVSSEQTEHVLLQNLEQEAKYLSIANLWHLAANVTPTFNTDTWEPRRSGSLDRNIVKSNFIFKLCKHNMRESWHCRGGFLFRTAVTSHPLYTSVLKVPWYVISTSTFKLAFDTREIYWKASSTGKPLV